MALGMKRRYELTLQANHITMGGADAHMAFSHMRLMTKGAGTSFELMLGWRKMNNDRGKKGKA